MIVDRDWSKIPKQTFLRENGEVGDCWRCCIAAIINMPAEEVPHFLQNEKDDPSCSMDADTQEWLNQRGWQITEATQFRFHRWGKSKFLTPVIIACGPTCRSTQMGQHHSVLVRDGRLIYDPHPSEAGLTAITDQHLIFRIM